MSNQSKPQDQSARDNRAGQLDDHNPKYHRDRGASPEEAERLAAAARKRDADAEAKK